ncbi:MAG: shikimate kinase [Bacteroidaceae bacterium]|nr:shikimate kinase [Bacteroidaceae bacterium]
MTRIILLGYMGAGKTTIGKVLAREMKLDFYDLDWYIEDRFHKKIPDIFADSGETGFREIERKMLHEVAEFENVIISCGGGTPCYFDNMDYMNQQGETFFLNAPPSVLKEHLLMGKTVRPLIQGKSHDELEQFVSENLQTRLPFYTQAKHTIDIEVIHTKEQILNYVNIIKNELNPKS